MRSVEGALCHGVWLPKSELHFRETLERIAQDRCTAMYPVLAAAMFFVERRRRCVDVGAHVGLWSRWLVRLFEHVDAFEPMTEHADLFARNVCGENWVLHRQALGETAGRVALRPCPEDTGRAHVCGTGDIEMRRLDSFAFTDVDLVKVDVEGYELAVMRGAEQTLRRSRPIVVIEQAGHDVGNFGATEPGQSLDFLESIGMRRLIHVGHDWVMGWEPIAPSGRIVIDDPIRDWP